MKTVVPQRAIAASTPFYSSLEYARNSSRGATPFRVEAWNNYSLRRPTPGGLREDCSGVYPMFSVPADPAVEEGLQQLKSAGLVSFVGVLNPLASPPDAAGHFPIQRKFKVHYVVNRPSSTFSPSRHHIRAIARGRRRCRIEIGSSAPAIEQCSVLYNEVAETRGWSDVHRFSHAHWKDLAQSQRVTAFRAIGAGGDLDGMALFVDDGELVYYHLAVSSPQGREDRAGHALIAAATEHFTKAEVLHLGGGAGLQDDPRDGLSRFKAGFANGQLTAWLVGAIFDRPEYDALSSGREGNYFPAYRSPRQT